jgi:hypothetical protein
MLNRKILVGLFLFFIVAVYFAVMILGKSFETKRKVNELRTIENSFKDNKQLQNSGRIELPVNPSTAEATRPSSGTSLFERYEAIYGNVDTSKQHLTHEPITSEYWEVLAGMFYFEKMIDGEKWFVPHFPDDLLALDGKKIELKGYMVPLSYKRQHQTFLLSVLPVSQCHFCGQGDIPEMVEVILKGQAVSIQNSPVKISGNLKLNKFDEEHFTFVLENAEIL